MKRLLTTILVLLSLAGQSHAAIEPKLIKSPGGITAWFFNDPNTPVIAINFLFRGGARLDPAGKAGLASITSDLLDSGTMEKDPNQFDGLKQDYAIQMDFTSDADQLGGSLATLVQHKDIAFDLLHEVLTSPRLKEDVFANVMNMARTSLANETNEPNYLAKRKMQTMLFKGHSYENPVDGLPGTIEKITLKDIGTFIKSNLTKDRLVVSITGNLSEADAIAMLDKIFGSLPEKSSIPLDARIKPAINGQHEIIDLKIPQSIIFFVLPGVMYDDPDFMKSALLMHIMGEGFTSRLYREIREKHGLAYAVFANNVWSQEAGYLGGMVGSPKAKASQSIQLLKEQWALLKKSGVTAEELADAKTFMLNSYPLHFKNSSAISKILLGYQFVHRPIDYFQKRDEIINSVTLQDMNDFVAKYIEPEKLTFVIVGRPEEPVAQAPEKK